MLATESIHIHNEVENKSDSFIARDQIILTSALLNPSTVSFWL